MNRTPFAAPRFAGVLAVGVALITFVYRFNQLGGTLGGFENDHFIHLSTARQIVAGDLPFRDYTEAGAPLTVFSSAVAQMLGGHALLPDALLTVGLIAVGTAIVFWLAARASGSLIVAAVLAFIAVALSPRPYAYSKILLYAVVILAAWRYLDKDTPARLAVLASIAGVGCLFRHDHGAYLGAFGLATVVAAHGWTIESVRRAALLTAVAVAWVLPYLVFIQLNGGLGEYLRNGTDFARRDAARTSFIAPRFELGSGEPLLAWAPEQPRPPAEVKVRWAASVTEDVRKQREQKYRLTTAEHHEGTTWSYLLEDTSIENITALVSDTDAEDTDGLTRNPPGLRRDSGAGVGGLVGRIKVAPELTSQANALAWLYYLFVAVAPAAAIVLLVRRRAGVNDAALPYVAPVVVLTAIISVTLLSRGATAIRLPDVAAPVAALAAWLMARTHLSGRGWATLAWMLVAVTTHSAVVLGEVPDRLDTANLTGGLGPALERSKRVARELATKPPLRALPDLDHPGSLRVAEYLQSCTAPGDRAFVFGNHPEVYFFAGRPYAGSYVWLVPGFAASERDQQRIVERLRRWRVPVVVTEPLPDYDEYRRYFPLVASYLEREYRDAGPAEFGTTRLRVLTHARAEAHGTFETSSGARLPCFAPGAAARVAAAR
jgi:hypothetical protein